MKSLKYAGLALCSMLVMAGCSQEEIVKNDGQQMEGNYTLTVNRVLESRTWLPVDKDQNGEYPTYWSENEKIEVASGDRKVRGILSIYEGENTANARFKGLVNGAHSKLEYAVFPVPNSKGEIDLTARSYKSPNAPMIGTFGSDKSQVNFENTCGMFRLVINNYPADTDLIVNGEGISGTAKVKYDETAKKYTLEYTADSKGQITITETPSETGSAVFYIPVITDQVFNGDANDIEPTTITVTVAGTEASITKDLLIAKKVVSSSENSTFLTLTYIPAGDGREAQLIEAWDSSADTAWYDNNPDATEFTISKASELAGLAQLVNNSEANGGVNFIGKTIKLAKSINLDGKAWTPIGQRGVLSFRGTFDGQGNTISNFVVTGEDAGLFGQVWGATIQNLNIDGATIGGETAGAVIAYVHGSAETMDKPTVIQDVNVTNTTVNGNENEPLYGDISGHAVLKIIMNGEETIVSKASILGELLAKGGTVTLEEDITLIEPIEIPAGVTVTLDLNGKTISNANGYIFENKANLTIDGEGTFEGLGIIRSTAGKVTINGGNFYASSKWQDNAFQHTLKAENTEVEINGGNFDTTVKGQTNAMLNASTGATITINGGTFKNVKGALSQFDPYLFTYEKDGKVIINDGIFYGGWRFNGETASTEIYGGNFTVGFDGQSFNAGNPHIVTVYGGTFTFDTKLAEKLNDIVADGYKAIEKNGVYHVTPDNVDNIILTEDELVALGGTKINGTYLLMADLDMTGKEMKSIELSNGATVEFIGNGHTITNLNLTAAGIHGMTGAGNEVAGLFDLSAPATTVSLTVSDLTIEKATVSCSGYAAAIVGYNSNGGTVITLNNVDVNVATITAETVAALVGYTTGAVNLTDCDVSGLTLTGEAGRPEKVGALVGTANTATCAVTTLNCTNRTTYGDYGRVINGATWNGVVPVATKEALQQALNDATGETVISLDGDITGDVIVTQKSDVKITIKGNEKIYNGTITIDGGSATITSAGLTIKNVNFETESISADACIRLGDGTNDTRYTCNVTVDGCTFDVPGAVGIKSYTGGDKYLTITGCKITERGHSLVQAKGIDPISVKGCFVYSKNGLNFNNSPNVFVENCTVDVKGYAVRFGESSGGSGAAEVYHIKNCTLKSACDDGDAVIILRGTADFSTLTIEDTTIEGSIDITNTATGATVVK